MIILIFDMFNEEISILFMVWQYFNLHIYYLLYINDQ